MRLRHSLLLSIGVLALAGKAWAGPLGAVPPALTFPDTGVGACSQPQSVTFTNNGGGMVNVMDVVSLGPNGNEFPVDPGAYIPPFSIGAGVNFTVTVKFCPQAGGQRTGTLTAKLGGGVGDATVPLTGKAIGQKLTVTPSPINAGGAKLNVTTSTKVTIQNSGGGNVLVKKITLQGQNANEFTVTGLPMDFPAKAINLGPGGAGAISITLNFTPAFQGNMHTAQLNLENDDPNLGPNLVTNISGYGGDPKIAVDASTAAFGNLRVGLVSPPSTINVQNIGNSSLKISQLLLDGDNPKDFRLVRDMIPDGTVIPAMGQLPITVAFAPMALNPRSARVVIVSDDPNTPAKNISLVGNGTMAQPAATPNNINFMTQTVYLASLPKSVVFTNMGNDAFNITKIDFTGPQNNPAQKDWFRVNGIVVFPIKVAPGAMVKVDLIALPLMTGPGTATVTFTTDDAMTPKVDVALSVNGISSAVKLDPAYGDFGTIGVLAKYPKTFTLTNVGTGDLSLKDFRFIDPMQCSCFQVNNMPMPDPMNGEWPKLKPMESLMFSVLFSPQVEGAFSAQIEIDTDDPMAKHVHVPLDGAGAQAAIKVDPTMLNFGTVLVGNPPPPQNVTITNAGGTEVEISTITLSGSNPNNFSHDFPMGSKLVLAAGQSKVVTVSYQPVAAGMHTASLVITPKGFAPAQVKLNGVAVQPIIQVSTGQTPPTTLDFDVAFMSRNAIGAETEGLQVGIKVPSNGIAVALDRVVSSDPAFRVDTSAWMANLSPGGTTQFNVYFTPPSEAPKQGKLDIYVKGVSNALATVTVKGSGIKTMVIGRPTGNTGCSVGGHGSQLPGTLAFLLAIPGLALIARRRRQDLR